MKFYDIVKKPNKVNYLKEAYTGQFTIGFELEGICTWGKYLAGEDFHLPSYGAYSERNQPTGGARILKEYLDKIFKIEGSSGDSKIESDSSLNTRGIEDLSDYRDAWNFEYATNKIPFNAKNLEIIYNGLSKLDEEGIFTNNSCGFHIHMSFPEITKKEVAWIMCCIAIDEKLIDEMLQLKTKDYGTLQLFDTTINGATGEEISGYAKINFLLDIRNAIEEKDYTKLDELLNNNKYRVLHIASDKGTIEWRGPRGFLNYGDVDVVKAFVLKWYKIMSKIAKMTQVTTYQGTDIKIEKEELLSHLSLSHMNFDSPAEKAKLGKLENLFNMMDEDITILFSLNTKVIDKLFKHNPEKFVDEVLGTFLFMTFDLWCNLKDEVFNKIFNCVCIYYLNDWGRIMYFVRKLWYAMEESEKPFLSRLNQQNMKMLIYTCTNMILSIHSEYTLSKQGEVYEEILKDLDILNTEIFKDKFMEILKEQKYISEYIKKIMEIVQKGICDIPQYMMKYLMSTRNMGYIPMMNNLDEKYQIRLIKKDPFNIQYITNPTEKVIQMAMEMNPNVKDYIRGE